MPAEQMTHQRARQLGGPLTDQRAQVLDLYNQGLSTREMAILLGVSTQRIHQQLKKLELPAPSFNKVRAGQ